MKKSRRSSTGCISSGLLAGLLAFQIALPVHADEAVSMEREGKPGIWMPSDMAKQVLADVEKGRATEVALQFCKARADVKDERIVALKEALDSALGAARVARSAADEAVRVRRVAEESTQGWFAGKPLFWTVLGTSVGVVGTISVVYLVRR